MSFKDRLRDAEYIAPSGNSRNFLVDELVRVGGKKGGVKEILDSNDSVGQDQGNVAYTFPIKAYFTGPDYDEEIDRFVDLLEERYSRTFPGTIRHPRWGNIDVMPVPAPWTQTEFILDKQQYGLLEFTLVKITKPVVPLAFADLLDKINDILIAVNRASTLIARSMDLSNSAVGASVVSKFITATTAIAGTISNIARGEQNIIDSVNSLMDEINTGLADIEDSIEDVTLATQNLIRLATGVESRTTNKTAAYALMTVDLFETMTDSDDVTSPTERRSTAMLLETVAGFSVMATAEAAALTDFTIAADAITGTDVVVELFEEYKIRLADAQVEGNAVDEYSGDHNITSLFFDGIANTTAYLLNNLFDLKAERKIVLNAPTDILNICDKYYKSSSVETIRFFIDTNRIANDEHIEIPAGREVVVYA